MDEDLLKILACPICKDSVEHDKDSNAIVCPKCGRRYPIVDEIPVMLVDRAETGQAE